MTPSVFDPRLEYTTVAETTLSDVDGENGALLVGGYPIEELAANATYEECVFLLLEGRLPTAEELERFESTLAGKRELPAAVRSLLREAAADGASAMAALRMGLAAADLGLECDAGDPRATAERVVAVAPTIVATYWRSRQGMELIPPDEELGHAANYLSMLTGENPTDAQVRGLETFLTTILEHGLNPSTFTARTVASTESDLVSAAAAAVGTLKGPRHGGNLASIFETLQAVHDSGDPEGHVRDRLAADDRLLGFGHRIYHVRDPRAAVLAAAAERFDAESGNDDFLESVREYETVATELLASQTGDDVEATVEFYAAALLHGLGISQALFTATFAVSRVGGWMAHCLEQLDATDLVRPTARYVGATEKTWTPVADRHVAGDTLVERPIQSSLEPISETLAVLSEPHRLEILLVLYDRDERVAYSTLRATSSIDDKGRFNYHLRQLRECFITDEDGYALTGAGRTFVRTLLTDDQLLADLVE